MLTLIPKNMKYLNQKSFIRLLFIIMLICMAECKKDEPKIPTTYTDIDGNNYNVIVIGTQAWTKENLNTTRYNDGVSIPLILDGTSWSNLSTPGYCWYENDVADSKDIYGLLYNWYTVNTGKLCPKGWHVPTDAEFTTLTDYLISNNYGYQGGGTDIAKSLAAPTGWTNFGTIGTVGNGQSSNNSSGFKALAGGHRSYNGVYNDFGNYGFLWTASQNDANLAYYREILYNSSDVFKTCSLSKLVGFSVRCLKDN